MIWQLFYRLRENKQVTAYRTYLRNARRMQARDICVCREYVNHGESQTVDLKGDADSAYSYLVPRMQDRLQCL